MPKVLILGGCGFIGRNLVDYLVRENLVELIRVADKVPPQIAWLSARHQETFAHPIVHFKSANLMSIDTCRAVFKLDNGDTFDYVINCACETKPGQTDTIYKDGILKLSLECAKEAARVGIKKYIELSSGHMGSNSKVPLREEDNKEPWTAIARWKAEVEDHLKDIDDLNYSVIRPAYVYGPGDRTGLMPLIVIGSIYSHLNECMKWLWTKDIKMNTVHVDDVCHAIWHILQLPKSETFRQIYHVVDENNSCQGSIADLISDIFKISHDFIGTTKSTLAKLDINNVVDEINDKHMAPWAELCNLNKISYTPLSPFINKELVDNKNLYLDGTKLMSTGFKYSVPQVTAHKLKEVLDDYTVQNLFPSSVLS